MADLDERPPEAGRRPNALQARIADVGAAIRGLTPRHMLGLAVAVPALAAALIFPLVYNAGHDLKPIAHMLALYGLLAVSALRVPRTTKLVPPPSSLAVRVAGLAVLMMMPLLMSDRPYQGIVIYGSDNSALNVVRALVSVAAVWLIVRPPSPRTALFVLLTGGLAIRAFGFATWEIHPGVRDMLPLVISAGEAFMAGENPYAIHPMQIGSQIPLTYPPAMWLAYLPTLWLDIDIRWTNWVCDAVVALAIGLSVIRRNASLGAWVLVGLAAYLYSPDVHWNGIYAEPHVDWAVLALLFAAFIRGKPPLIGVAYGIALLTRPFNALLLPLLIAHLVRRYGLRVALRTMTVAGLIAAVGFLPFVLRDPDAFYFGALHWLLEYGEAHRTWFHGIMGFSGQLYLTDRTHWMLPVQLASVFAGTVLAAVYGRDTRRFLLVALFTYATFVAFNSLIWMSFWVSVALFAVVLSAVSSDDPPPAPVSFRAGPRWLVVVELAATLVVAASGATLGAKLYAYFDTTGREEVAAAIQSELDPSDVVVDWSGERLQFITTDPIIEPTRSGPRIAASPYSPLRPDRRVIAPGDAPRMWVVDRFGDVEGDPLLTAALDGESPLYTIERDVTFGRYRLLRFDRRLGTAIERWSDSLPATFEASRTVGGAPLAGDRDGDTVTFRDQPPWTTLDGVRCAVEGWQRPMIFAHPTTGSELRMRSTPPDGARVVLITAGLMDRAVEWQLDDVAITVELDGRAADTLPVPNATGLRSLALELPSDAATFELVVTTGRDTRRDVCLDVAFWR